MYLCKLKKMYLCKLSGRCRIAKGGTDTECCGWGCCTKAQYNYISGSCTQDNSRCPGRFDNEDNIFCCKTKCCSAEEYAMHCVSNDDCPKPGDGSDKQHCCTWGCCRSEQYKNTETCKSKYDIDCPGKNDNRDQIKCCKNRKCCNPIEEFVPLMLSMLFTLLYLIITCITFSSLLYTFS